MTHITEPIIIDAVDCSVIETIEAYVRFRPGFHGDTGIRDYLYYRLMTNLPDDGRYTRTDGGGTLLAQAEWYTELMYRNTGKPARNLCLARKYTSAPWQKNEVSAARDAPEGIVCRSCERVFCRHEPSAFP